MFKLLVVYTLVVSAVIATSVLETAIEEIITERIYNSQYVETLRTKNSDRGKAWHKRIMRDIDMI